MWIINKPKQAKINNMALARLIKETGVTEEVSPKNGKKFTLEELQKYVGGLIEFVQLNDKYNLIINEEGKINNKCMPNSKATKVMMQAFGWGDEMKDIVFGDVLLVRNELLND